MSNIHTLKDLPSNSEAYGFTVDRKNGNKCTKCLETVFPNFRFKSITSFFVILCVAMYIVTKVIDATVMSHKDGDNQSWVCTLHLLKAKYTYDIT